MRLKEGEEEEQQEQEEGNLVSKGRDIRVFMRIEQMNKPFY